MLNFFRLHRLRKLSKRRSMFFAATAATAMLLGLSIPKSYASVMISSNNSTFFATPTSTGPSDWDVNGINQLGEQWFWYRIGNSPGQTNLISLTPETLVADGTNYVEYSYGASGGPVIYLEYSLVGGSSTSKTSDLNENIMFENDGTSAQTYHFFMYSNFNLDDSTTGQTVDITGGTIATVNGNGYQVQTSANGAPSLYQASNAAPDLLNAVSSTSSQATLTDVASASAGDPEWAFEWSFTLQPGGSFPIAIDNLLTSVAVVPVPEPKNFAIVLLGLTALLSLRSRSRSIRDARAAY